MVSLQDQVVPTRTFRKYITKYQTEKTDKYRLFNRQNENIDHVVVSSCQEADSTTQQRSKSVTPKIDQHK